MAELDQNRQLTKPRVHFAQPGELFGGRWVLQVPDHGSLYCTIEPFPTYEAALDGLADWWANGNRASFLRYPGTGRDRRREVIPDNQLRNKVISGAAARQRAQYGQAVNTDA